MRWTRRARWTRKGVVLVSAGAVLAGVVAVGLATAGGSDVAGYDARPYPGAPAAPGDLGAASGAESALPSGSGRSLAAPSSSTVGSQPPGVPVGGVQRSLVRMAQVAVEVADPVDTGRQLRTAAAAAGGYVTEERTGKTGASMVLRVPADGLDRLIDEVAGLGKVLVRSAQVVDATEEVVDLDARVASQQASVARVRALLARAESIGDVVAIESELSRREAELDSLTGRLAALRAQVAFSTLSVDLRAADAPAEDDPATFAAGLAAGWDGLRTIGVALGAAVGFVLPFLPVLALLAGVGWLARRALRTRRAI